MLRCLGRYLNEPVMGFLALAALTGGIAPMLFAMPAWLAQSIAVGEWVIIGLFALEYLVHLALAEIRLGGTMDFEGSLTGFGLVFSHEDDTVNSEAQPQPSLFSRQAAAVALEPGQQQTFPVRPR